MYDIIKRKRDGGELSDEEISFFIDGYVSGEIPDYQASALCMAVFYRGMSLRETTALTMAMVRSGDVVDLSRIPGIKVDKHSTGGVGDKTSLVVVPLVASLGVRVAKMSGRGLGHTGGTLDKLESIPGLSVSMDRTCFERIVSEVGCAIIGQTGDLVPADKRLYALRDVTATVDSIPLIASSIMSKKIAAGTDGILLDVTCGSGALMKTLDDALDLAQEMVSIANMDRPLGYCIGNALEVAEAVSTLRGEGPKDLTDVCVELAATMVFLVGLGEMDVCRSLVRDQLAGGLGLAKLKEMVAAQGGEASLLDDACDSLVAPRPSREVTADRDGYLFAMDTERCGLTSVALGAGRAKKDDAIDHSAGIVLVAKPGAAVRAGDVVATLHAASDSLLDEGERLFRSALDIRPERPKDAPLIYARVSGLGVERTGGAPLAQRA